MTKKEPDPGCPSSGLMAVKHLFDASQPVVFNFIAAILKLYQKRFESQYAKWGLTFFNPYSKMDYMKTYRKRCEWCKTKFTATKFWARFDKPTCRTMKWNEETEYKRKSRRKTIPV